MSSFDTSYSLRTHKALLSDLKEVTGHKETGEAIRSILDFFLDVIAINPILFSLYRKVRTDEYISVAETQAILKEFGFEKSIRALQYWCSGGILKARKFPNTKDQKKGYWQVSTNSLLTLIKLQLLQNPEVTK